MLNAVFRSLFVKIKGNGIPTCTGTFLTVYFPNRINLGKQTTLHGRGNIIIIWILLMHFNHLIKTLFDKGQNNECEIFYNSENDYFQAFMHKFKITGSRQRLYLVTTAPLCGECWAAEKRRRKPLVAGIYFLFHRISFIFQYSLRIFRTNAESVIKVTILKNLGTRKLHFLL